MPSRRHVLATLWTGLASTAGCSARPGDGGGASASTRSATTTPTRTPSPAESTSSHTESPTNACETAWQGATEWTFSAETSLSVPRVTQERVFVADDEHVLALSPADGSTVWEQGRAGLHVYGVEDGVVLARSRDDVVALDAGDGAVLWTFAPPGEHARWSRTLPVHGGTVYVGAVQAPTPETVVEEPYGRLYGLDLRTGAVALERDLTRGDEPWVDPDYVVAGEAGVFLTLESGGLVGVDHDGTVRWRRDEDRWYYRPAVAGDVVLQPTSGTLVAVDAESGETRWLDGGPEMHVGVADGVVYGAGGGSPATDGDLAALEASTGTPRWQTAVRGCGRRPVVASGVMAIPVGCRDGPSSVVCFDAETGCRYGGFEPSADPMLAAADGRLYASVGAELVVLELPG